MKWLRKLIAEEVAKVTERVNAVETNLTKERALLVSFISLHVKDCTNDITAEVLKLANEFEAKLRQETGAIIAEKNQIISELQTRLTALQETVGKISHWKADGETVEADNSLKLVK